MDPLLIAQLFGIAVVATALGLLIYIAYGVYRASGKHRKDRA